MREEVVNWWKQAQEDLKTAEANFDIGRYYAAAFFTQQSIEKGLKALYIYKKKENIITHNLIQLARKVGFPEDKMHILKEVNPAYSTTRYVDAANGVPAEIYDDKIAKEYVGYAKEALKWIGKALQS